MKGYKNVYSYIVNSAGEVIKDYESQAINFLSPENRLDEINSVAEEILPIFHDFGINADVTSFDYMFQPLFTEDRLLFFTKTELDASARIVREAYMVSQNPDAYSGNSQKDLLKSIFSIQEKNRTLWYLVYAESIVLERNLYDTQYINLRVTHPVPYHRFMNDLKGMSITDSELKKGGLCDKYIQVSPYERDCSNIEEIIQTAVLRNKMPQREPTQFETALYQAAKAYAESTGITLRDNNSNRKMLCLHQINDNKDDSNAIFKIYNELKQYLKHTFPEAYGICYKKNAMYFRIPGKEHGTIFISNAKEEQFIVGGKTVRGMEELKKMIADDTCYHKKEWFEDIQSYITKSCKLAKEYA